MLINNTKELRINDYSYSYDPGIEWYELANGRYRAADRGSDFDHYSCSVTIIGELNYIEDLIVYLETIRGNEQILTDIKFPLFGNNINYDGDVKVVIDDLSLMEQDRRNSYSLTIDMLLTDCIFDSDYPLELPDLNCLKVNFKSGKTFVDNVIASYNKSNITYNINKKRSGRFEGTFTFTYEELAQLQHFQRINRSLTISNIVVDGIDDLFGPNVTSTNGKLYSVSNIKYISPIQFEADLVILEE